jgi:hypothetical protein
LLAHQENLQGCAEVPVITVPEDGRPWINYNHGQGPETPGSLPFSLIYGKQVT